MNTTDVPRILRERSLEGLALDCQRATFTFDCQAALRVGKLIRLAQRAAKARAIRRLFEAFDAEIVAASGDSLCIFTEYSDRAKLFMRREFDAEQEFWKALEEIDQ